MATIYTILRNLGHYVTNKEALESEKTEAKEELLQVVSKARENLFLAKTVFPFTLFPDSVTIDRTKLTVVHRVFFMVADVISIKLEDILNITPHVGPFFGSIEIHTRFFDPGKPYTVNFLKRPDALKMDRILHGYSIALERNIDTSVLDTTELAALLDKLGQENAPV